MAVDRFQVEELISNTDPDATRLCPRCRLPHDPDPRIYFGAGRTCPKDGHRLVGILASWREQGGEDDYPYPEWFGEVMG